MGILTHIKDLTLGDRPEMKFTSGLGIKGYTHSTKERNGDQKKSQFKIIHRKQPQGKQYDTGGHLMPTFKKLKGKVKVNKSRG